MPKDLNPILPLRWEFFYNTIYNTFLLLIALNITLSLYPANPESGYTYLISAK